MTGETGTTERRQRPAFRALVQEMLNRLRDAASVQGDWTPEERERAERDLKRIMAAVHTEALRGKDDDEDE